MHLNYLCASHVFIYIRPEYPRIVWILELHIQPPNTFRLPVIVLVVTRNEFDI